MVLQVLTTDECHPYDLAPFQGQFSPYHLAYEALYMANQFRYCSCLVFYKSCILLIKPQQSCLLWLFFRLSLSRQSRQHVVFQGSIGLGVGRPPNNRPPKDRGGGSIRVLKRLQRHHFQKPFQ